ncbi:MAG: class I SAM-dependent methyltransferase [Chloroflexi bacterium]|nr:class I SAM-dependent methyltransferase [Chloroflexota bacterium]
MSIGSASSTAVQPCRGEEIIVTNLSETPSQAEDLPILSGLDTSVAYRDLVLSLMKQYPSDEAMERAVGGEFEAFGILERELLIQYGLHRKGYLIDVGCGSGRLAKALVGYLEGKYLGIDIIPELVNYARDLCKRPDWRFEVTDGLTIPEQDNAADMVCFFSVFTHLRHESSYLYLREARRVLKAGGKVVFSFVEYSLPTHWKFFETNVSNLNASQPFMYFISRDAIAAWSSHLGYNVEAIHDGDKPHIPIPHPIVTEKGIRMETMANFRQSVCVLTVPNK